VVARWACTRPGLTLCRFFDIVWDASPRAELHDKVVLPLLGKPYGEALESQEIRLEYASGVFTLRYFDHSLPVATGSSAMILAPCRGALAALPGANGAALAEYDSILTALTSLPSPGETDPTSVAERQRETPMIQRRLAALTEAHPPMQAGIAQTVTRFNGTPDDPHSVDQLDALVQAQAYRLCDWRVASEEINYRRFFDINDLAALRMEKLAVFAATHALLLRLLGEGKVQGLRIDHPDGLYDPQQYLERLQHHYVRGVARRRLATDPAYQGVAEPDVEALLDAALSPDDDPTSAALHRPLYVVVEKILGAREALRETWPVAGTSGYDFLNVLNGLFVAAEHQAAFTRVYRDWTQDPRPFPDVVYDAKRLIMQVSLASEVHMLAQ
jgi:(1->4)-alpha-D-glucan 1-alpha-D-glucosylmutase